MPFPSQVQSTQAPAVVGDFADNNPRAFFPAGPGGLVAGPNGVTVGQFVWLSGASLDQDGAPALVNNYGSGPVAGLVPRTLNGMILTYLQEASLIIPAGFELACMVSGTLWVKNAGTTEAIVGNYAYANYSTGAVSFAAAASGGTASVTGAVAASTGSFTGSITGSVLTITAVGSGVVVVGGTLSGTNVATGTMVVSQLSGTAGGIGTYQVNIPEQAVASTTISETYGTFTVSAVSSGTLSVGDVLSGSGVTTGTYITALGTGTGGTGTYVVSPTQTASSTTVTAGTSVQTKWVAMSAGAAGELVKISSHVMG